MQILTFIIVIGIAIVVFYLFIKKIFKEDRLVFPDDKPEPKEEKTKKERLKFEGKKSEQLDEERPEYEEKQPSPEELLKPNEEEQMDTETPTSEKEPPEPSEKPVTGDGISSPAKEKT